MLLVVEKGREREVEAVFEKWDLHAVQIGVVTTAIGCASFERGQLVADVPNARADRRGAGVSPPDAASRRGRRRVQQLDLASLGPAPSPQEAFDALLASPVIASKRWAYRQYDHTVGTNTIAQPGASAGVVRVKGTSRALAVSVDGNGRFCYLDPYRGGDAGGGRVGPQRGVRRRRADRRHQQPELRQPRTARDHVAARRGRARDRRCLPRRSTFRSPAATSACTTKPRASAIYPDARPRRRRAASRTRPHRARGRSSSRARRWCCWATIAASLAAASTWRRLHGRVAGTPARARSGARAGGAAAGRARSSAKGWSNRRTTAPKAGWR